MYPEQEQFVAQIGEIHVTNTTVHTPAGPIPLRGTTWELEHQWQAQQGIPVWAVVCAVVGFLVVCFLSLLFLLIKETTYTGVVRITVRGPQGTGYTTNVPVTNPVTAEGLHNQVNYLRFLSAQ